MTIRLRAHHLLCMLTYVGKGYTPAFTVNYDRIAERLSQGEEIVIVEGPDDVCAPLLTEAEPHCFNDSVAERDRQAARDIGDLLGRRIGAGERIEPDAILLAKLRAGFGSGLTRTACAGCEWAELCSAIVNDAYTGVKVGGPPC
ncbi:DUF1284 domain-containing protein [Aquamicrobium terrae]|uniref:DUF1284 domain-containing protein n=1 Tax=Aquamicrobium terrae TaxID=1324945 RepID=A0ABV2N754_9HYPH